MDLLKLKEEAERKFEIEYKAALAYARAKVRDPRMVRSVARKIARKRVDSWLSQYGLTLQALEEKIYTPNVSLEELAVG